MSQLLIRWGLGERLEAHGVKLLSMSFHRYSTGERVGFSHLGPTMECEHGASYYHLHRADLLNMLLEIAAPYMKLQLGSRVQSINVKGLSATLASGHVLHADLIIDDPLPTGDSVDRAIIPTAEMLKDPILEPLVAVPELFFWMGPAKHIVGYCIRAKTEYNLVLICPDHSKSNKVDSWTAAGNIEQMQSIYVGSASVEKLLNLVKTTMTGQLVVRKLLTSRLDSTKRVALIGDACHPMLPYRAQGSAMAIEDAAEQIEPFLEAYQEIRSGRATSTQAASFSNRKIFHFPDAMVEILRGEKANGDGYTENANMWADKKKIFDQFSYDADEAVDRWWRVKGQALNGWMDSSKL
ncbi:hypothetical protein DFH08DRAFT_913811 [Mycena albidolilacea]|uniref:FAD-binding domain-containing protein n=1 Tax=Mycena albidolilacea TaxID=1033008 RepID=A0AAD7EUQ6_9AGAR|nr:hypothetical protein DFH08DRAFT_913811 [Mycena albidolilacea]